jgi:hypothetical protein
MWNTILFNIVLSIVIIFATHHIWDYCKQNYTTHKVKDLADIRASKYKSMLEDMERSSTQLVVKTAEPKPEADSKLEFVSTEEKEWIRKELDDFMRDLQ